MADEDLSQQIIALMQDVMKKMHTLNGPDDSRNLSMLQFRLLCVIKENEDITMSNLANILHVTGASMTAHIDALVASKLVKRQRVDNDRRSVVVKLSTKGEQMFAGIYDRKTQCLNKLLASLDQQDKRQFIALLTKINSAST